MKNKSNYSFRSRPGKSTGRLLYILLNRKFRNLNEEKIIVWLSILIFLMQLLIIVTAVTAGPERLHTETTGAVESDIPLRQPMLDREP